MKSFTLSFPENADISEPELRIIVEGDLYQREKLSLGQAVELADLSKPCIY